ncbi:hypothetical protein [Haladaptatus caseinilyticus]|uniref:hypothetical protein n=1 Tax=Haladaptatus caseinilyticus TaxID=2993314 RepID=UPI00224B5CE4|nr:hypothetical protein [Haladaptatus caseinilyticus]
MNVVVLDANAVVMHGRAFPDRVRTAVEEGLTLVLPRSVKQELVDDVLAAENAPVNHHASAQAIQQLVDDGFLVLRIPDFETYSGVIDEARQRIADDTLPEHTVKADQYIPALVCGLATDETVHLATADTKLRAIVQDIVTQHGVGEDVILRDPLTVL